MGLNRDRLLISELAESKEDAFKQIYDAYWEDLYSYVARILNHESEVEDIVQEVFVNLWRLKARIYHIHSLKAYLLIMAKNSVIKHLSKKQYKVTYGLDSMEALEIPDGDPEQQFLYNQLSSIIDAEIAALPNKMQEIFILSRKHQLSHKEIAEKLDISDQTVKKQINNTLRLLRHRLKNIV